MANNGRAERRAGLAVVTVLTVLLSCAIPVEAGWAAGPAGPAGPVDPVVAEWPSGPPPPPPPPSPPSSAALPWTAPTVTPPPVPIAIPRYGRSRRVAPGVTYRTLGTSVAGGPVRGGVVEVRLRHPRVSVGLLRPPVVAARRKVTSMATAANAVAAVNGDFFEMQATHRGLNPTGAPSGPMVDRGRPLKAAVPAGQRFGPPLPLSASTEDVIGVGTDGLGRVGRLYLAGSVRSGSARIPLRGLNQYALPVGGVGAYTAAWGGRSRKRAVCGSDLLRGDPCAPETAEVTVRRGVVARVGRRVGAGRVPRGTTVLVGRDEGAAGLLALRPGDRVRVRYRLAGPVRFRFAVGGFTILRDGVPPVGLDPFGAAPRTAAGVSRDGRRMYLVVVDGRSGRSRGLTLAQLSGLLAVVGADDAVNLDGGGSSTLALRGPRKGRVLLRNRPSDGGERAVANGIGVFSAPS